MKKTDASPAPAKRVVKKAETASVPAPVVAPAPPAPAPKAVAETKKASPAPVVAPAPAPVEAVAEETTWQTELTAVKTQLTAVRDAAQAGLSALTRLEKRVNRELKEANRGRRRTAKPAEGEERKPSVFNTPIPVSDELASFLGKPKGTTISRADVTKAVSAYVKSHGLNNKHAINADAPLQKLLGVSSSDQLTIFNLQKYLNRHYIKPATNA